MSAVSVVSGQSPDAPVPFSRPKQKTTQLHHPYVLHALVVNSKIQFLYVRALLKLKGT